MFNLKNSSLFAFFLILLVGSGIAQAIEYNEDHNTRKDTLSEKAIFEAYHHMRGPRVDHSRRSLEKIAEQALAYKKEGFPTIGIKMGTTAEKDIERIRAMRKAIGFEIPIRIDANQGWKTVTAIKINAVAEDPVFLDRMKTANI